MRPGDSLDTVKRQVNSCWKGSNVEVAMAILTKRNSVVISIAQKAAKYQNGS